MRSHIMNHCYDTAWYDTLPVIIVLIIIGPIGIPLLYLTLLLHYKNKNTKFNTPLMRITFGFITEGYRADVWYFELFDFIFKFLLFALAPLLPAEGHLIYFQSIVVIYTGCIYLLAPYIRKGDDLLHLYSLAVVFLVSMLGYNHRHELLSYDNAQTLAMVLSMCMLSMVPLYFFAQLGQVVLLRYKLLQYVNILLYILIIIIII